MKGELGDGGRAAVFHRREGRDAEATRALLRIEDRHVCVVRAKPMASLTKYRPVPVVGCIAINSATVGIVGDDLDLDGSLRTGEWLAGPSGS